MLYMVSHCLFTVMAHRYVTGLYVEDHAKALIKVVTEGEIGETYNIGGHNEKTNLEVVETICDLLEELAPEKASRSEKLSRFNNLC